MDGKLSRRSAMSNGLRKSLTNSIFKSLGSCLKPLEPRSVGYFVQQALNLEFRPFLCECGLQGSNGS